MYPFKNIIVLLFLSFTFLLNSQGGFRKKYYLQNSLTSVCGNVIEAPNGDLIQIGFTYNKVNNHYFNCLTLVGTDPLGNILWRKDYGNFKFEYLDGIDKNCVVKENNFFYFVTCVRDSLNKQVGVLLKLNYNGDTLWQRIYSDNASQLLLGGLSKSVDGGLLITGACQYTNGAMPHLIIKIDLNGNVLWKKTIHKAYPDEQKGVSIKQDSISKKIISVGFQFISNGANGSDMCSNVLITDSLGNKITQTTLNNNGGGAFNEIIQLHDKNFLTAGAWLYSDSSGTPYYQALIVKFDTNGNIIWRNKFNEAAIYNRMYFLHELSNGDIISVGRSEQSYFVKPQIFKLDKNGNLKWKRTIANLFDTHANFAEGCRSMNHTKDGGFILSSVFPQLSTPHPYSIIKVDSTACDTTEAWCTSVILGFNDHNKITGYSFELFPNPASNSVSFKINAPVDKKFNVKIIDVSGKELELAELNPNENLELNVSRYQPGIYFVEVLCDERILETKKLVVVR